MAFGDEKDGTLFLWEVPSNIKTPLTNEHENIEVFWKREVDKCNFVVEQREQKKEEYTIAKAEREKQIALAEQAKEISADAILAKEMEEE
jgi:predicted mannosyl-3-phosphoglycerate phosphatase (HAD superfamily)